MFISQTYYCVIIIFFFLWTSINNSIFSLGIRFSVASRRFGASFVLPNSMTAVFIYSSVKSIHYLKSSCRKLIYIFIYILWIIQTTKDYLGGNKHHIIVNIIKIMWQIYVIIILEYCSIYPSRKSSLWPVFMMDAFLKLLINRWYLKEIKYNILYFKEY